MLRRILFDFLLVVNVCLLRIPRATVVTEILEIIRGIITTKLSGSQSLRIFFE